MGNYERLMELAEQLGADTDNKATYMLTCNQIRDFCRDAIGSGRLPSDAEIDRCVGEYRIYDMDETERRIKALEHLTEGMLLDESELRERVEDIERKLNHKGER